MNLDGGSVCTGECRRVVRQSSTSMMSDGTKMIARASFAALSVSRPTLPTTIAELAYGGGSKARSRRASFCSRSRMNRPAAMMIVAPVSMKAWAMRPAGWAMAPVVPGWA